MLARVETHLVLRRLQKQVEVQNAQLQRARDELEERVKERTADLAVANEQLVASEKALEERLRFESLLADISGRFINLPVDRVEDEIKDAQRRICELLDLDRSSLLQVPAREPGTLLLTHMHPPPGGPPIPERMNARDLLPWSAQKLLAGETITIAKITDLPPEAGRDRESLAPRTAPSPMWEFRYQLEEGSLWRLDLCCHAGGEGLAGNGREGLSAHRPGVCQRS